MVSPLLVLPFFLVRPCWVLNLQYYWLDPAYSLLLLVTSCLFSPRIGPALLSLLFVWPVLFSALVGHILLILSSHWSNPAYFLLLLVRPCLFSPPIGQTLLILSYWSDPANSLLLLVRSRGRRTQGASSGPRWGWELWRSPYVRRHLLICRPARHWTLSLLLRAATLAGRARTVMHPTGLEARRVMRRRLHVIGPFSWRPYTSFPSSGESRRMYFLC